MIIHMKRTTLILDDALLAALRGRAAREGRTLTEIVERTLRAGLGAAPKRRRIRLPSYDLGPFLSATELSRPRTTTEPERPDARPRAGKEPR
jgi:hypothetical protein